MDVKGRYQVSRPAPPRVPPYNKAVTVNIALDAGQVLNEMARLLRLRLPEFALQESIQTGRAVREMRAQLGRLPGMKPLPPGAQSWS
jgi:hypothetical protein